MDESNTKLKIINRLIELLGWDDIDDVEMEYSVKSAGQGHSKVDYALSIGSHPDVLIRAKGLHNNISGGKDQLDYQELTLFT